MSGLKKELTTGLTLSNRLHASTSSTQIPGLLHVPAEDSACSDVIKLTSFDLKTFTVPTAHRYGRCRPVNDFDRICVIGEGSYGTVYKVKDRTSGEICALKRRKVGKDFESIPQNFLREITNLKVLKHENIVNLLGIAVGKNFESNYLILEYCEYLLSTVIDDVEARFLQHPQIKNIMKQLFAGLDYLHKNFILHRDISPSNILFTSAAILKISDFGLSRKEPPSDGTTSPNVGLRWYQAAEILFGSERYSTSVDIWSSGCIFGELLLQKQLFRGNSDAEVIRLIIDFLGTPTETLWPGYSKLPIPKKFTLRFQPFNRIISTFKSESQATISLIVKTLRYNPAARPTAEQCLQHAYFDESPPACSSSELLITLKASKAI